MAFWGRVSALQRPAAAPTYLPTHLAVRRSVAKLHPSVSACKSERVGESGDMTGLRGGGGRGAFVVVVVIEQELRTS